MTETLQAFADLIAQQVRLNASVQAYSDAFWMLGVCILVSLFTLLILRKPRAGLSYEALLSTVERRLPQIPRYRQKIREVPVRLILGVDAEKRVQQAEAARAAEASKWRHLTVSTVFEDGQFDRRLYTANSGINS